MPKKPHYQHLKEKWTQRHRELQQNLAEKHKGSLEWLSKNSKQMVVSALGGLLLLAAPGKPLLSAPHLLASGQEIANIDKNMFMASDVSKLLPSEVDPLTPDQEQKITDVLSRDFGLKISAELNGIRLNRNYGKIGAEQHLARYPGDSMSTHFDSEENSRLYWSSGMAPGLGAWGYFAPSQTQLTQEDKLREEYYIAVPTFLSEGFNQNTKKFTDFYKYRKMLVVNPENGRSVVAVIGDAGPATWTGKHLGGSPEVMHYLQRVDGAHVGPVLYFFIDDPENKIPLGPISAV